MIFHARVAGTVGHGRAAALMTVLNPELAAHCWRKQNASDAEFQVTCAYSTLA